MAIRYYIDCDGFRFNNRRKITCWLRESAAIEGFEVADINIIFTSSQKLLEINREFLSHDYYTDIITFDYSSMGTISGDLFISLDRVRENGQEYGGGFTGELSRVIIHGVLHLLGYKDKSDEEAKTMREKEDFYLDILKQL